MSKDLTNSAIDRQNVLNNPYALAEIEKAAGIRGIPFEGKTVVLKEQVAVFFEVTLRTVENYLEQNTEELARNGYEVVSGNRLKGLKLAIQGMGDPETNFGITGKTVRLGVLDFRAFLNLAMLMKESERAGLLRKAILDTFDAKLTHLFFCACKFHCFQDGNKRIAIALCAQMLLLNGYLRSVKGFIRESENISYHVAAGSISKELLSEWIGAVLRDTEDDESLKLKIYNAIAGTHS